ncbi:amino acid adenylation domain-containing protein/thioester reductase-like protein, partial [Methylobacter tundripaludum]
RVRAFDLDAYAHQDLPFELLVDALQPTRSMARHPLFQVMLALQNTARPRMDLPGLSVAMEPLARTGAKFDLLVSLAEQYDADGEPLGLWGELEFSSDLFDVSTVERLIQRWLRLIEQAVAEPDAPLYQCALLTPEERHALLEGFNATTWPIPDATIPALFEAQTASNPAATALVFADRELSYGELNAQANQLAHHLQTLGVGPNTLVGICVERSFEMLVGVLAILKAGGAYMPLDPDYPQERLRFMLDDAAVSVLLTQQRLLAALPSNNAHVLCLDRDLPLFSNTNRSTPPSRAQADDLAYLIYTSGSTGQPKGVAVTHRNVVRLARSDDSLSFDSDEVFLQLAPLAFDASTLELWAALLNGGRLVLMPPGQSTLEDIGRHLTGHRVTTLWLTAGLFHLMVDERLEDLTGVRRLFAGGEALSVPHVQKAAAALGANRVINGYGPTENTTFTSCYPVPAADAITTSVPIGKPIANTRTYILDDALQPVPVGVVGELYTGGLGLARAYLNRPALTAERFVADPFSPTPGARMYRTGDLARWHEDGNLEFIGRADGQVKIRGFRIEPGEIETALLAVPEVTQAAVVARDDGLGLQLVAYWVPSEGSDTSAEALRLALSDQLPDYMLPSAFVALAALPLTANGKLDRRTLPAPERGGYAFVSPSSPEEAPLAALFAEVLGLDQVSVADSFFALGGHSLLATRLVSRVREVMKVELPIRALFEAPTVAQLALRLRDLRSARLPLTALPRPDRLPLSYAQQRLWFIHRMEGPSATYNIPIALRLAGPLNADALERALLDLLTRHEALRTRFPEFEGVAAQQIVPVADIGSILTRYELSEAELTARLQQAADTALDISVELPFRAWLFCLGNEEQVLLMLVHHIAADGSSMAALSDDLTLAYNARCLNQAPDWPNLPLQYADYALWQRQALGSVNDPLSFMAQQLAFWKTALRGLPDELNLPTDRPRPLVSSYRGTTVPIHFSAELHRDLLALVQAEQASLFMLLQATLAALLSRLGAGEDIAIGAPIAGRTDKAIEDLIGFFVNTLVLRTDLSGRPSLRTVLQRVRTFDLNAYEHQDLPFELLVDALQPSRSMARHPLFQVMLVLQNTVNARLDLPGINAVVEPLVRSSAKFDLSVNLAEFYGDNGEPLGLSGELEFSSDLFDADSVERLSRRWLSLIEQAVAQPDAPLHQCDILSPEERSMLLNNQTYVLDNALQPVPAGVVGELYTGDIGYARAYLTNPVLCAERFVADPFSAVPGLRMYRTGDLVRRRKDGNLEFIGRADAPVKVRGVMPVETAELKNDFIPSRTPTESALAEIWSEVLHLQQVDRRDNFFELGGHSLLATQVVSRIQRNLGIVMPFRALFENPSLGALAGYLDRQCQTEASDSMPLGVAPPILPVSRDQPLPLSFAQQRLWFIDQIGSGAAYNMSSALRLRGQLNVSALEQSLTEVVRRHESLRTTFDNSAEQPYQHIRAPQLVALPVTDLSHLPDALRRTETRREAQQEAQKLFDLSRDLMLRARLLRLDEDEHVLLLSLHHIAADGWSNDVLVRELAELYEAFATDKPSALAELPVQYADFAVWQRQWLQGEVLQQQTAFWKKQLQGAPALLALPTDRPRPPVESFRGGVYPVQLDAKRTAGLRKLSRDADTTLFTTLLAAFQVLLARYSGQDDIVVGSPIANRNCLETEPLIGFFVNTLALRADLSGNPSFSQVLAQVKHTTLLAQDHQDLPFERLVEELQVERNLSYNPIVQIVFALQAAKTTGFALPGLEVSSFEFAEPSVRMDLELHLWEQAEGIVGGCSYAADLFDATTIARLMGHFYTLLDGIIADPERPILGLALLDESESRQILVDWNRTAADLPKDLCLHQLFEQQAAHTPDQAAVVFAGQSLSYRQLDRRANQLAHHLQSLGVVPDSLVGICVERSADMVVGILAIHKAGGAYLPLDPAYPPERLAYMLEDAAAPVLLTQAALLDRLPAHNAKPVYLDSDWPVIEALSTDQPSNTVTADNLAYVIYTSGSTGNPKGVLVEHRGVCSVVQAQIALLGIGTHDRVLQFASLSFDAAASETMLALGSGAALYLGTHETLAPGEPLRRFLTENAISLATVTPSTLAALPEDSLPALRTLGVAGEACSAELFGQWAKNRRFFNLYGPTEASICATAWRCETITASAPPIGRPLANVQVYILDALHQPVPIGVAGELYIGGVGVARGYLNRPELTEEKFIANPFGAGRVYKTGDLTRWLPDGNIEYLGRIDQQVKIRGFRIEPGEIESVLAQHPAVREAVVLARADQFGKPRLVAYLLTDGQESPTGALREWLQGKLPDYMVPAAFVRLETWPLTPNGKLDRQGLPEPDMQANESEYLAPQTLTESALAEVWRKVLNVERVGRQDNFFELGGHSLLLTQLIYHIEAALGVLPTMRDLFSVPTLSTQAAHLDASMQAQGQDAAPMQSVDFAAESQLDPAIWPPTADFARTAEDLHAVLITGASGFLGAYLLDELARQTSAELYCLVRADNAEHGAQRLRLNLERHGLWRDELALRLHPVVGDLEQPRLGLSVAEFDSLAERVDAIYHSGAHDNFLYPYAMLKAANVDGTHELLRLAARVRTKPLHFVSTLSVVSPMVEQVSETEPLACPEQTGMGYVDTKWVAEQLVQRAAERGMPVTIHRPTHILGVSDRGYTHIDDAWYRRLLNDVQLGTATGDDNADDNLVPVGFVSRAIVHLSLQQASLGKVFHLSNPSYTPRSIYQDVLRERGYSITLLPFDQWLAQLVEAAKTRPDLGLIPLLPMLTAYDTENPAPSVSRHIHYVNTTAGLAGSGIVCPEIRHTELRAYFAYLIDEGHFPPPQRPTIKSTD